jgi:hypothetical protein
MEKLEVLYGLGPWQTGTGLSGTAITIFPGLFRPGRYQRRGLVEIRRWGGYPLTAPVQAG